MAVFRAGNKTGDIPGHVVPFCLEEAGSVVALFQGLHPSPKLALGVDGTGLLAVIAGLLKVLVAKFHIVLEVGCVVFETDAIVGVIGGVEVPLPARAPETITLILIFACGLRGFKR